MFKLRSALASFAGRIQDIRTRLITRSHDTSPYATG